jgi:hypothetical protein
MASANRGPHAAKSLGVPARSSRFGGDDASKLERAALATHLYALSCAASAARSL